MLIQLCSFYTLLNTCRGDGGEISTGVLVPHEVRQVCINTLASERMTPEEEVLGYFTRKKLKKLATWNNWEAGEHKQINQLMHQNMFEDPTDPLLIPGNGVIMRSH